MTYGKALLLLGVLGSSSMGWAQENCLEKYEIDKVYTNIVWYANRMGFSRTIGKFANFEGTIDLNTCELDKSKIFITIDTNSITSGAAEIDRQLKSATFFDVEKYPEAIFESTNITFSENDDVDVKGNFTMLGKTKEIILKVQFNKKAMDLLTNKMRIGYSIKTTLTRSKWGMDQLLAFVSDDINIVIEAEALKLSE